MTVTSADVYERFGVQRVINAAGRMTMLGGVALTEEVAAAMAEAGRAYVRLEDLKNRAGEIIARLTGAEAACLTTGAAAGIVQMVAACVVGDDPLGVEQLPDVAHERREILIQLGHWVGFGAPVAQMVRMGGGRPTPVGLANSVRPEQLALSITAKTAGYLYVQSHHTVHHGMLSLDTCIQICHERSVPVIVDAAAEEDASLYVRMGVDAVTYSGGKAFGGPTSGFILGRAALIRGCRAQERGIARPMKVGKETIVGLLVAMERYLARDATKVAAEIARQQQLVNRIASGLRGLPGISVTSRADEAGRAIVRAAIAVDPATGKDAAGLARFLTEGPVAIYPRGHRVDEGFVAIDPRPIDDRDADLIVERVRRFVGG